MSTFQFISFCFALLFCNPLAAVDAPSPSPWKVEVTKNREMVPFGDTLNVTIHVDYPISYEPNLFEFLMQQRRLSDYGYFQLLSSSYEMKDSKVDIHLQLQPVKIGPLIFTPGNFFFTPKESSLPLYSLLVPAFSIESKGLFPTPQIAPPLPFNPEAMIHINSENYKTTFENPELIAKEQNYNLGRSIAKSHAWTTLAAIFFIASLAIIIFWFLKEYNLLYAKRKPATKPRDLQQEFRALQASTEPLDERFSKLSELLRCALSKKEQKEFQGMTSQEITAHLGTSPIIQEAEKKALQDLFSALDSLEFSERETTSDEEWKTLLTSSRLLFK